MPQTSSIVNKKPVVYLGGVSDINDLSYCFHAIGCNDVARRREHVQLKRLQEQYKCR